MEIFNNYYAENSFRGMCTVQKYHYDILVSAQDNAHLIGESTSLVSVQSKQRGFEKIL